MFNEKNLKVKEFLGLKLLRYFDLVEIRLITKLVQRFKADCL
jgi:hypothetical protein